MSPSRNVVLAIRAHLKVLAGFVVVVLAAAAATSMRSDAATPGSGSIPAPADTSPGQKGGTTWTGPALVGVPSSGVTSDDVEALCLEGPTPAPQCDIYQLTFNAASDFWTTHTGVDGHIRVVLDGYGATTDIDLYVFDSDKALVDNSGNAAGAAEEAEIPRPNPGEVYYVVAYYFQGGTDGYHGHADLFLTLDDAPNTTNAQLIRFAPPTWADFQREGAEPMINVDHRGNGRVFIDWPFSSQFQTSIYARSLDDGETFRTLFDPNCSRTNSTVHCAGGGGGDAELRLAPEGDTVYMADQIVTGNFTIVASPDGGDTFPYVNAFTSTTTLVDRMWLGAFGDKTAHNCYHTIGTNPPGNMYCNTTTDGGQTWSADFVPGFFASQSGPLVVDTRPGKGTVYHVFRTSSATSLAVSTDGAQNFTVRNVAGDFAGIFPWLEIDTDGNLYIIYTNASGSDLMMTTSLASDPANVAAPGSKWSNPVRVSAAPAQTTVLASVTAGSPGRMAMIYYGTDGAGNPNNQPDSAQWHIYVAHTDNALCSWTSTCDTTGVPHFTQQVVDRRVTHTTQICTSGTTCTGNRNLADMIDMGYDIDGRLIATWSDDNNDGQRVNMRVGRQLTGPSLLSGHADFTDPEPTFPVQDAAGDAVWPNTKTGVNQPAMDITNVAASANCGKLNFVVSLADVTKISNAISTVKSAVVSDPSLNRYLLVIRFESDTKEYFVAFEHNANGTERAFSGEINAADGPEAGQYLGYMLFLQDHAATYHVDSVENTITISANLADVGNPAKPGGKLLSVVAATLVGATEATANRSYVPFVVDATRATDYVLTANTAPIANAVPLLTLNEGAMGTLDASASSDADGDALTFVWSQAGGSPALTLSDVNVAQPTFTAPGVSADSTVQMLVTVKDCENATSTATETVNIVDVPTGGGGGGGGGGGTSTTELGNNGVGAFSHFALLMLALLGGLRSLMGRRSMFVAPLPPPA